MELVKKSFTSTTVDLGLVVSDMDKAAKFYTEAVGFKEINGFSVSEKLSGESGLADYKAWDIRVFVLGDEPTATRLKISYIPGTNPEKVKNEYLHSSLGFSYITVRVADMDAAIARAAKAGVEPVKPPYKLGGNNYLAVLKDPDGNFVELIGPGK